MKNVLYLLLLVAAQVLNAQDFTISVSPTNKVCYIGDNVELDITITPLNNFSATVFFETKSIFSAKLSSTISNPPYSNIKCSFLIESKDIGTNTIEIIGRNGTVIEKTECTIEVLPLQYWKSVKSDVWYSPLIRNLKGRIELPSQTVDGTMRIFEYDSLDWKVKSEYNTGISNVFRRFKPFYKQLVYDSSGNIWFEMGKYLVQYDGQYFRTEEMPLNLGNEYASIGLTVATNGIVYCVISDYPKPYIGRFIDNKWVEISAGDISLDLIYEILATDDGSLWVRDMNDLFRVTDNSYRRIDSVSLPNKVRKMCKYQNRLYCLTENSINYFEQETWTKIDLPYTNMGSKMTMAIGNRGEIYVAYSYGLSVYENGNWRNFEREKTLLGKAEIDEMIVDMRDNVWMYTGTDFIIYNSDGIKTFAIASSVNGENSVYIKLNTINYIQTLNSIVLNSKDIKGTTAEVFDIHGNRIFLKNIENINDSGKYELSTENLVNGLYLLRIGEQNAKFLIHR